MILICSYTYYLGGKNNNNITGVDEEWIVEHLSQELINEKPLFQCLQVADKLEKLIKQRENTIAILTEAAGSLVDISKTVAKVCSTVGTGKEVAQGTALLLGSGPLAGSIAAGTEAVEIIATVASNAVGAKQSNQWIAKVREAIEADRACVKDLHDSWVKLEKFFEGVCVHIPDVPMPNIINAVFTVFSQVKEFVTSSSIDWTSIMTMATSDLPNNPSGSTFGTIKGLVRNAITTAAATNFMKDFKSFNAVLGIGATIFALTAAILFGNAHSGDEDSTTAKLSSAIKKMTAEKISLCKFSAKLRLAIDKKCQSTALEDNAAVCDDVHKDDDDTDDSGHDDYNVDDDDDDVK